MPLVLREEFNEQCGPYPGHLHYSTLVWGGGRAGRGCTGGQESLGFSFLLGGVDSKGSWIQLLLIGPSG